MFTAPKFGQTFTPSFSELHIKSFFIIRKEKQKKCPQIYIAADDDGVGERLSSS